jgi:hypothetical protein
MPAMNPSYNARASAASIGRGVFFLPQLGDEPSVAVKPIRYQFAQLGSQRHTLPAAKRIEIYVAPQSCVPAGSADLWD